MVEDGCDVDVKGSGRGKSRKKRRQGLSILLWVTGCAATFREPMLATVTAAASAPAPPATTATRRRPSRAMP